MAIEFGFIRLGRLEGGFKDLPLTDARRCRYYIRANNEKEAKAIMESHWPNEEISLVAKRNVPALEFSEEKSGHKRDRKESKQA